MYHCALQASSSGSFWEFCLPLGAQGLQVHGLWPARMWILRVTDAWAMASLYVDSKVTRLAQKVF